MRTPSIRLSSGDSGLGNSAQAISLASHCGTSIRAVASGSTSRAGEGAPGVDNGMNSRRNSHISRGSVRGRFSADTVVPMSEEVYPDPSKHGSNPLAPTMPAPSHESTAESSSGDRSNPLSTTLGVANDSSQRESVVSGEYAPSSGLDAVITDTGTWNSQLARPEDHLTYRSSIRSSLHRAASQSRSRKPPETPRTAARGESGGSRNERRRAFRFRTSSSESPPMSPSSGGDFTTRLERIPLLDEGPTLRKSAKYPWSPTGSKHRVRAMAAMFEKAAQDSSAPRGGQSRSSDRRGASGSGRSVSCPVEGRSSHGSSMEESLGEADEPFSAGPAVAGKGFRASERAWERLAAALEDMGPDDLAVLQEILAKYGNPSRAEGAGRRSDESEKGREASGHSSGVSGRT